MNDRDKVKQRLIDEVWRWIRDNEASYEAFAGQADISYNALRNYMSKKVRHLPNILPLSRMCAVLGVSADYILYLSDRREVNK